jgi:LAO/AO transport system kinase
METSGLAERVIAGHVPSAARVIRLVEDGRPEGRSALRALYPRSGRAHVIGVTGPPGAGKSTLVGALVGELRRRGRRVGVLAVDPSSPRTGGALLGDRVRMQRFATDPGVFIRSMASRGAHGGLARTTWEAAVVLDAFGCDAVIVETVGVGQTELAVADLAHTTALVCLPGAGDEIQALKAGLLELAQLLVLNKADLPGADDAERALRVLLHSGPATAAGDWELQLLRTVAAREEGIAALADVLDAHRAHLERSGELALVERRRLRGPFLDRVRERLADGVLETLAERPEVADLLAAVERRELDPYAAADLWLEQRLGPGAAP